MPDDVILLRAALRPFAEEGRRWVGTSSAFDDLKLLCGEDWGLLNRPCREAKFTIGDLKRALAAFEQTARPPVEKTNA